MKLDHLLAVPFHAPMIELGRTLRAGCRLAATFALLYGVLPRHAQSQDTPEPDPIRWIGGSGEWPQSDGWSGSRVPDTYAIALVNEGGEINVKSAVEAMQLRIADGEKQTARLLIERTGSLTLQGAVLIGRGMNADGRMVTDGGELSISEDLHHYIGTNGGTGNLVISGSEAEIYLGAIRTENGVANLEFRPKNGRGAPISVDGPLLGGKGAQNLCVDLSGYDFFARELRLIEYTGRLEGEFTNIEIKGGSAKLDTSTAGVVALVGISR